MSVKQKKPLEYLEALSADPAHQPRKAIEATKWSLGALTKARKNIEFAAMEVAILEGHPIAAASSEEFIMATHFRMAKEKYLVSLEENLGASMQACLDARITERQRDKLLAEDAEFAQGEADVYGRLREKLAQEVMKIALGKDPKCRDAKHLQWTLGKLDPEKWGDKPKQVDVRHSGEIGVKSTADRIMELLGNDDSEEATLSDS